MEGVGERPGNGRTEKLFPVEGVRVSAGGRPEKLRNGRLKEVLLRDKPEVIRQRPKHFFLGPAAGVEESLLPLASAPFLFAGITGPRTNIHSRLTPLFTDGSLPRSHPSPPPRRAYPPPTPFFALQLYISLSLPWLLAALVYFSPPSSLFFPLRPSLSLSSPSRRYPRGRVSTLDYRWTTRKIVDPRESTGASLFEDFVDGCLYRGS